MKKVLFLTSYASPYRVRFFDELAKQAEVTVLLVESTSAQTHRDASWFVAGEGRAKLVQLGTRKTTVKGKTVCWDVVDWLKMPFDEIIVCGYSHPTCMLAMGYLRARRIPFAMEVDGGLIRQDSTPAYLFKHWLVTRPSRWYSTGSHTSQYLQYYGAKKDKILEYPFSSFHSDYLCAAPASAEEKQTLRAELNIPEEKVLITVGQFIRRKGFDILLEAAKELSSSVGLYFIGGEPTDEYRELAKQAGCAVHFVGFQNKEGLCRYYRAADAYVMPTREDIWGLVINEAMAKGLPIISTDRCVAGLELITDGENGYIVPTEDSAALAGAMKKLLQQDTAAMGMAAIRRIQPYTIENMVDFHIQILSGKEPLA